MRLWSGFVSSRPVMESKKINNKQIVFSLQTVSVIGLEFFSSLEFGFPGALHLQSTMELVLQYLSHGAFYHHFANDWR